MFVGTLLFSSQEHLAGEERSAIPAPQWEAAGWVVVSHPDAQGYFFWAARASSRVAVLLSTGAPARAQPRYGARGSQAKPRGKAPLVLPAALVEALLSLGSPAQEHWAGGQRLEARTGPSLLPVLAVAAEAWAPPGWCVCPPTRRGWICFSGNPVF